jgi:energy-coupling factor transporter ATP-binding protein EcfA2
MEKDQMTDKTSTETPNRSRWNCASLKARFEHLDNIYIKHPAVVKILNYIERELESRSADGRTSGLLIIAPTGAGKSALIKHLAKCYPSEATEEYRTCPVIAFTVPTVPSPKTMGAAMLRAMDDILWDVGTAEKKLDRIKCLLVAAKTRLVLVDNFQDIPTRRKSRGVLNVATWVRDVCDINFGGLVVAMGTAEAAQVRDANEQIQRRIKARLTLPVFSGESPEEMREFAKLLRGLDKNMPLAEESGIYLGDMPKRIHCATRGNFDYLVKLLKQAVKIATSEGHERLTVKILHDAFEDEHQDYACSENPFAPDFLWTRLAQPGQVFHNVEFSVGSSEEESAYAEAAA